MTHNELNFELLGGHITRLRQERDLTLDQLADALNVASSTVARWEKGTVLPSLAIFHQLAEVFGLTMDELVRGAGAYRAESLAFQGKPLFMLQRPPREIEAMGLRIVRLALQEGCDRDELISRLQLQDGVRLWEFIERIVFGDLLTIDPHQIPLDEKLAARLGQRHALKTCQVVDMGHVYHLIRFMVLGALGAQTIIQQQASSSQFPLRVGLAGGFACGRIVLSLIQAGQDLKLDVMPIAIQSPEKVVAYDANSLVGMLGFFTRGTRLKVSGLPYVSNAQLAQTPTYPAFATTRAMLKRAQQVELAFLGLGSNLEVFLNRIVVNSAEPDMFCERTLRQIEQMGCIGDILYTPISKAGPIEELQDCCDQMVCSIGLAGLRALIAGGAQVIAVTTGAENRARVLRVALERGYVNGLIIDSELAREILDP